MVKLRHMFRHSRTDANGGMCVYECGVILSSFSYLFPFNMVYPYRCGGREENGQVEGHSEYITIIYPHLRCGGGVAQPVDGKRKSRARILTGKMDWEMAFGGRENEEPGLKNEGRVCV